MKNTQGLKIHHAGFVVKDLTAAMLYFKDMYGITQYQTWDFNPMSVKIDGREVPEYKLKVAMGSLGGGDSKIELIEPLTPFGCHYDALTAGVKGIHHLCFTADNYDLCCQNFLNKKTRFIFEAEIEDAIIGYRRCFYAQDEEIGLIFEVREEPYFRNKA